MVFHHRFV
ncbi:hypothetical protein D046_0950, partial [Vibrio parahaemolyticus V-223/04]